MSVNNKYGSNKLYYLNADQFIDKIIKIYHRQELSQRNNNFLELVIKRYISMVKTEARAKAMAKTAGNRILLQ